MIKHWPTNAPEDWIIILDEWQDCQDNRRYFIKGRGEVRIPSIGRKWEKRDLCDEILGNVDFYMEQEEKSVDGPGTEYYDVMKSRLEYLGLASGPKPLKPYTDRPRGGNTALRPRPQESYATRMSLECRVTGSTVSGAGEGDSANTGVKMGAASVQK
jgi:hypothetical protein